METFYSLRTTLTGHSKDVRALAVTPDGCILSASRDKTAKLWRPEGTGFSDVMTYSGHQGFVSAVAVVPPNANYPEGLVVTGCNDHLIRGYKPLFPEPVFVLKGHSDTVCALTVGQGFLISGSWDKSAKVWQGEECVATLSGHEAAVWCVALISGSSLSDVVGLTGSADKTIVLWQGTQVVRKFLGHTDCVRALAVLDHQQFLSAANDASIRRWLVTGECTQIFHGHTNYVYSLTVLPNGRQFASAGEDRSVRLWTLEGSTDCLQTIFLPSQSVWALASLPSNDLVTGSSDGYIRIFTADSALKAPEDLLKAYQEELSSVSIAAQQELGGVKVSDLPTESALNEPGKKEGQTKMVRRGKDITVYSWSASENRWNCIGNVVGTAAEGDADKTGSKTEYNGQWYDFVFSVDIEEGRPPLKLPFNLGDDPYMAAQKFIHKHDLSQYFLDEIANFILKNIPANQQSAPTGSYADPFTGMETFYSLRTTLTGHSKDVRALAVTPDGCILSASRDKTAKLWRPEGTGFSDVMTYSGHQGFVSAVAVVPPNANYPEGLVVTGCNDHLIRGYKPLFPEPVFVLKGHSDTVCALTVGQGFLVSGSWDKSAKVWQGEECVATLSGHEAAVWCVALISGSSLSDVVGLTGSADKTIVLWQGTQVVRKFLGHTDCVRALAVLDHQQFLSAANDASIRKWLVTGECTQIFYGHTNYIYSLTVLPNGRQFASAGEDRSVRLWTLEGSTDCLQTIFLPSQSVWAVASLPNNDLVTGSSDGYIRIFTADSALKAPEDLLKAYQEELSSASIAAQQELGGVKVSDLPTESALNEPGKKEGQTKMVRRGKDTTVYSWSASENRWNCIGNVVGTAAEGDADKTGSKTEYNGQWYDFVFSVDIEEGRPPLKLPFNLGDDPYMAAQKFIHKHDLSQYFLDEIANFILKNIPANQPSAPTGSYADPFTGGNRYVPGSSRSLPLPSQTISGVDPFTGGGRYVPGSAGSAPAPAQTIPGTDPFTGSGRYVPAGTILPTPTDNPVHYFPIQTCLRFDQANVDAVLSKIKEFNDRVSPDVRIDQGVIPSLAALAHESGAVDPPALETFKKLMEWPPEFLFPVLDLLRLALRRENVFQAISVHTRIYPYLEPFVTASALPVPPNILLALRALANLCVHPLGQEIIRQNCDEMLVGVLETLKALPESTPATQAKNIQVAVATVVLNAVVLLFGDKARKDAVALELKSKAVNVVVELLETMKDGEARFRALVALGTLLHEDEEAVALAASIDAKRIVEDLTKVSEPLKVSECAKQVKALL